MLLEHFIHGNFNPRSREGSDIFSIYKLNYFRDFNPRSREGSDDFPAFVILFCSYISIHAPARGATSRIF